MGSGFSDLVPGFSVKVLGLKVFSRESDFWGLGVQVLKSGHGSGVTWRS